MAFNGTDEALRELTELRKQIDETRRDLGIDGRHASNGDPGKGRVRAFRRAGRESRRPRLKAPVA